MNTKLKVAVLLLLILLLGLIMGVFLSPAINSFLVPASHKAIVDKMEVIDTKANFRLTAKLVDSVSSEFGEGIPLATFDYGKVYGQTTWIWQRYGDTEFVMTVWGPGNDGKTYLVEFGKVAGDPFKIVFNGVTKLTIEAVTSTAPAIGYYQLEVQLVGW